MKEDRKAQVEQIAWIHKEKRIVTFHETEGFEKLIFRTQKDKMLHVYHLCESGYRIL